MIHMLLNVVNNKLWHKMHMFYYIKKLKIKLWINKHKIQINKKANKKYNQ